MSWLLGLVWVASWWGPRRLRVWFAMLAPFGSVALIVAAFLSVPRGSCEHGCVLGWAGGVDGSRTLADATTTLPVAVAIAVITGLVELVLLIRRNPSSPVDEGPSSSDPLR